MSSSLPEPPRRPRLLPQNRKLRHLRGLSLRNLTFAHAHLRTTDDAILGARSTGSPQLQRTKLEVLRESGQLHHSRSSGSLRADSLRQSVSEGLAPLTHTSSLSSSPSLADASAAAATAAATTASPPPPPVPESRQALQRGRRISLSLATHYASSKTRQKRLEEQFDSAVADVFFSLHVNGEPEPIYISEVGERSANFDFQFHDMRSLDPALSRACRITIRIWARRPKQSTWLFLVEELIDLRQLNFISTLLDRHFPPNALIFHLEDGIYSLDFPNRIAEPKEVPPELSSSYNALMKLANLETSIEDAIETRDRIMRQINDILDETPADDSSSTALGAMRTDKYISAQQRTNRQAERRRDELRASLHSRREAIAKGREQQTRAAEDIDNNRQALDKSTKLARETELQIHGQRRRICSELADVFPITPIPNAPPLSFQICGIALPNSTYDAAAAKTISEDALSAGLGLVTLLTRHLQLYLSHPLPYPLYPYGSRSRTRDDTSNFSDARSTGRDFPLYLPRGGSTSGQWRFEYAWFLLNKDIEALCASQGLRVVDIRHTLPNLKYLLYVCSAGTDEVPGRVKGGVRGLWQGRLQSRTGTASPLGPSPLASPTGDVAMILGGGAGGGGTVGGSRRPSADSQMANQHEDALREAVLKKAGEGVARGNFGFGSGLPFADDETKFTLRTKGLRENVSRY